MYIIIERKNRIGFRYYSIYFNDKLVLITKNKLIADSYKEINNGK